MEEKFNEWLKEELIKRELSDEIYVPFIKGKSTLKKKKFLIFSQIFIYSQNKIGFLEQEMEDNEFITSIDSLLKEATVIKKKKKILTEK